MNGHTTQTLFQDFRQLGIETGDVLFMHSSFKSLGPVDGGAGAVIDALEEAVGAEGTILLPSFHLIDGGQGARAAVWNHAATKSTVGWLTEFFRNIKGTPRSDHPSHSVCARGNRAEYFVSGHLDQDGFPSPWDIAPWGKTYGENSPMVRAYREPGGKLLMLGVDYRTSTYCHLVEVMYWSYLRDSDRNAEYCALDREKLGGYWDSLIRLNRNKVGDADCRLFSIRDYVDTLLAAVKTDPDSFRA